jgi:hypothetical protein
MTQTKIQKMVYCSTKVTGRNYQELDQRARDYGAQFFEVPVEQVSIFVVEDARPETVSKHGDGQPETWGARFRIGCQVEADEEPVTDDDLNESSGE